MKSSIRSWIPTALALCFTGLCLSAPAQALEVSIPEQPPARYCLPAPVAKVLQHATDYASYVRSSGATFSYYGFPNALKMTKSTEIRNPDPSRADSLVYVELRPLNSQRTEIFPRFFIRCKVTSSSATRALHECHIAGAADFSEFKLALKGDWQPFAVTEFTSSLEVDGNSRSCAPNQSLISYTLKLGAKDEDVSQVLYGLSLNQDYQRAFFQAFYLNFFKSWVQELPQ